MNKTVYFLSGTMTDERLWKNVFPRLTNITPVYIDITKANSFNEIHHIIDAIILAPAILVGFSLGGYAALSFALERQEKVKQLIVIATSADGLQSEEINLRKNTIQFLEHHIYKGISTSRIKQFLHSNNHQNSELIELIKLMDADLGKDTLIRQLKTTSKRISLIERLDMLNIPVSVIGASNDVLVSVQALEGMNKEFPNSTLNIINDSGHLIPLEQPNDLVKLLLERIIN